MKNEDLITGPLSKKHHNSQEQSWGRPLSRLFHNAVPKTNTTEYV